jgi:hypothetical protein
MSKKKKPAVTGAVLFDVVYQDGTRTSNRKVPAVEVDGLDGDDPAQAYIEAQDRQIAEKSGQARGPIQSIIRSGG